MSGQKKIRMVDLREHLAELDFNNIQTYVQSGNVIFETQETDPLQLASDIKQKILEKYGFDVPVLVKKPAELETVLVNNPFAKQTNDDTTKLYVVFLSESPDPSRLEKLQQVDYSPEEFRLLDTDLYLLVPNGYGRAKMNNNFFEQKLKVPATTRNWKTVNTLLELAGEK